MTKNSTTYYYRYDDTGQRIYKDASTVKEFYLRDHTGRDLAVYDMNTNKIKLANIFGNGGMIGRVGITWSGSTRTDTRYYYLKDHLGSTRLEFDRYTNVSSAFAYYAYGSLSSSYNNSNPNDKYRFTGKERDTETNYDYFGARYYDSDLGHWMSVDPLAVKYPGWSPYNYTLGNPVILVDNDGLDVHIRILNRTKYSVNLEKVAQIIKNQFESTGAENVHVYTGITGSLKFGLVNLLGGENMRTVILDSYDVNSNERGKSTDLSGNPDNVLVNVGALSKDGENDINTATANVASHELGHNLAKLKHPKNKKGEDNDDGSIMGTNVTKGTAGNKKRKFNKKNAKKNEETLNEK